MTTIVGNQLKSKTRRWGVRSFDRVYQGLPNQTLNLLRSGSKSISYAAIGAFIQAGILRGERVALIGFDHPDYVLSKFRKLGFEFAPDIASEQLMYFFYQSRFSYSLSFSTSYQKLFDELYRMAGESLSRIAFFNADVLFNLETHLLAKSSAERIISSFGGRDCVLFGCYQAQKIRAHQLLHEVACETLPSYFELSQGTNYDDSHYKLYLHKFPAIDGPAALNLQLNQGNSSKPDLELVGNG